MANGSTYDGGDDPPRGAGGRSHLAEILESDNARLSDYRLIRRAIREGYPIDDELKQTIIAQLTLIISNPAANTRAKLACIRALGDAMKINLELIKLGHKDQHQLEREARMRSTTGKLPANDPDAPDSVSKQPTAVSLENFVLSLPALKIADESQPTISTKRTG